MTTQAGSWYLTNGPLITYVKLQVSHVPGMPGNFSPRDSDPDMHHDMCVAHVPWCMPGSLTSGFLWSRWRRKRSRHSPPMHNPKFYASGERSMGNEGLSSGQCILDISRSHFSTILTMDTHTIRRPSGRGMVCLLWMQSLSYVFPLLVTRCMQYHVI